MARKRRDAENIAARLAAARDAPKVDFAAQVPLPPTEAAFAAKALDLQALRDAMVDAAGVGAGLWFSYLFVLLYLAIAVGGVTHRDLLLENPIKLPFLAVDLPLLGFFVLAPGLFLIVHAYVLLHLLLLAGKAGAFHAELERQITDENSRARLRRQLPSNVFVQLLAGPREVRTGIIGYMLRLIAQTSLVAGPLALLVFFQFQFLPYHHEPIAWWQRLLVLADLALLWMLWPSIARGETTWLVWRDLRRGAVAAAALTSLLPLLLVFTVATFPGEWLYTNLPSAPIVPTRRPVWKSEHVASSPYERALNQAFADLEAREKLGDNDDNKSERTSLTRFFHFIKMLKVQTIDLVASMDWTSPHKLLVAGDVDFVTRRPKSVWSNRLVLPGVDVIDRVKFDTEQKIAAVPETVSLRGRRLEGAVFIGARLRKVDFTAAHLQGVRFDAADLREANFLCDTDKPTEGGPQPDCADVRSASLDRAHLQGAHLDGADLREASFESAKLNNASLNRALLQGAILKDAELQGASLQGTHLESATLDGANLLGASLQSANFQRASLVRAELQDVKIRGADLTDASLKHAKLPGVSFVGVAIQGADFDQAYLQGASLDSLRMQRVRFAYANLQGANLDGANLQGAYLNGARLNGASLDGAKLQGASLSYAHLEGASLSSAELQGADLGGANLNGASLKRAQLQGVSLNGTTLKGALLDHVFVWRTDVRNANSENVRVVAPETDRKYRGSDCETINICDWSEESFVRLKKLIEQTATPRDSRREALNHIEILDPTKPLNGQEERINAWDNLARSPASLDLHERKLADQLREAGCDEKGAPFVIRGLIKDLGERFGSGSPHPAVLAIELLNEANCAGARELSEQDKVKLRDIVNSAPAAQPGSAPTMPRQ
jgi:uncharacterized protein YjbI with pentapeptide repeats